MSQTTSTSTSSSNFRTIFVAAVKAYEKKTKTDLHTHPLATQLQSCNSSSDILTVLHDKVNEFETSRSHNERLSSWLNPTINVLYAFSTTLGQGVGLVSLNGSTLLRTRPTMITTDILARKCDLCRYRGPFLGENLPRFLCERILNRAVCQAAKDVEASEEALADLFERIANFFRRLESYTEVPPSDAMTDMIVKIMVEILNIFAIATKEIKQGRTSMFLSGSTQMQAKLSLEKFLKKLVGRKDVEDALARLDKLTQEEARMAAAQILRLTHSIDDKVKVVDDKVTGVRDEMKDVNDKMGIVLNGTPDVSAPQNLMILTRKTSLRREGCKSSHRRREVFVIISFTAAKGSLTCSQGTN
jgi:hypothetical protein